jgi:hypothetical protein
MIQFQHYFAILASSLPPSCLPWLTPFLPFSFLPSFPENHNPILFYWHSMYTSEKICIFLHKCVVWISEGDVKGTSICLWIGWYWQPKQWLIQVLLDEFIRGLLTEQWMTKSVPYPPCIKHKLLFYMASSKCAELMKTWA